MVDSEGLRRGLRPDFLNIQRHYVQAGLRFVLATRIHSYVSTIRKVSVSPLANRVTLPRVHIELFPEA